MLSLWVIISIYTQLIKSASSQCGPWRSAVPSNLICSGGSYQYKYQLNANVYFVSPVTTLLWSWDTYQPVNGDYFYTTDGTIFNGISCTDTPDAVGDRFGIGCSNGPGNTLFKVLPAYTQNRAISQAKVCENHPNIFSGACTDNIEIYYRVCSGSCPLTSAPTSSPTSLPTMGPTLPTPNPTQVTEAPTSPTEAPTLDGCRYDIDTYLNQCYCDGTDQIPDAQNNPFKRWDHYDVYNDDGYEFKMAVYEFMQAQNEFVKDQKRRNEYYDKIMYAFFGLNLGVVIMMIYGCLSYKKLLVNNQRTKGYSIAVQDIEDE